MPYLNHKALYLAAFLSFSLYFNAHAQAAADTISRDYVINLKGDTIKGKVLWVGDGSVKIDPFKETHTVKYKTADIKEACQTGQIYVPIKVSLVFHDMVFAKRLEHGAVELYQYYRQSTSQYGITAAQTIWYAGKAGVPIAEIKTTGIGNISRAERKKNFMALIADNEALSKEFDSKNDYSFDYLFDVIKRYNQQAVEKSK
ncbi:MAG: hypothetical protein JWQ66_653 [Mucilaginibacter sp.]|jgi:hypothetical protein|nr:hypothetical protein [Mucilaginibacter sp.]